MHSKVTGLFLTGLVALLISPAAAQFQVVPQEPIDDPVVGVSVRNLGEVVALGDGWAMASTHLGNIVDIYEMNNNGDWRTHTQLTSPSDASWADYGHRIALQGTTFFVSMPGPPDPGVGLFPHVYVYELQGEEVVLRQTIDPPAGVGAGSLFGASLTVSGDTLLIGASGRNTTAGSLIIYKKIAGSWVFHQQLQPADSMIGDAFGAETAMNGTEIFVGAPQADTYGINSGAVYSFKLSGSTWAEFGKVAPTRASAGDAFGLSISTEGNRVAVGAPLDDGIGGNAGSAYVFERDGAGWRYSTKLTYGGTRLSPIYYGESVSIHGDQLLVGAPEYDQSFSARAFLYHLENGSWEIAQTFNEELIGDRMGSSVALNASTAMIGSGDWTPSPSANKPGKVMLFDWSGQTLEENSVFTGQRRAGVYFGSTISAAGDHLIVGSRTGLQDFRRVDGEWVWGNSFFGSGLPFGGVLSTNGRLLVRGSESINLYFSGGGLVDSYRFHNQQWDRLGTVGTHAEAAAGGSTNRHFGSSVGVLDDTHIVVGASGERVSGVQRGTLSLYELNEKILAWERTQFIVPPTAGVSDLFGSSMSASGNTVIVGSPGDDTAAENGGAAYIYILENNQLVEQAKLVPPTMSAQGAFGYAVAVHGDVAVVGAPTAFQVQTGSDITGGRGYIYRRIHDVWELSEIVSGPVGQNPGLYGYSVGASDGVVAVGCLYDPLLRRGVVNLYEPEGDGWETKTALLRVHPGSQVPDYFGRAIAMDGSTIFVSTEVLGNSIGRVEEFEFSGSAASANDTWMLLE